MCILLSVLLYRKWKIIYFIIYFNNIMEFTFGFWQNPCNSTMGFQGTAIKHLWETGSHLEHIDIIFILFYTAERCGTHVE